MTRRLLDLPAMDKASPYCTIAAFECVLRARRALPDLHELYGFHTIESRRSETLAIDERRDVNVFIGRQRHAELEASIRERLLSRYGYRVVDQPVTSLAAFREQVVRSVDAGEPLASYFDLGFLPHRREYGSWYQDHYLVVAGYDDEHVVFADQFDSVFAVPNADVQGCIERANRERALGFTWQALERVAEPSFAAEICRDQARYNLENLTSSRPSLGLSALRDMVAELHRFAAAQGEWFGIPGAWTMAPERQGARRWLGAVARQLALEPSFLFEVEACYEPLVERWYLVNRLCEKSFISHNPRDTRRALQLMAECLPLEEQAAELWARFGRALA